MRKRLLLSLTVLTLAAATVMGCGTDSQNKAETKTESKKDATSEKAPLRVATSAAFAPTSYKDEDGNLAGFEHDVIEEIGKRSGREVQWTILEGMDSLFGSLDAGKVDTIAYQVSVNEERKANYTFSNVYGHNKIYLAVRDDFKYDTLDDLQSKKVSLNPAHSMYPVLEEYNASLPDDKKIEIVPSESNSMYEALEMGRFDAFPLTPVAFEAVKEKKDYKIKLGGEALVTEENAYPFSKDADKELLTDVNDALQSMVNDGTLSEISIKHYKLDVTKSDE